MSKAPDDFTPKWMIEGRATAQAVTEELLKEKSEDELPPFAKEILEESRKKKPMEGMTTPSLHIDTTNFEEQEIWVHLGEMWVVLRKIARTIVILTAIVMVLPGISNSQLTLSPYQPAVLLILEYIINFAKNSLLSGGGEQVRLYIGSPLTPISLYINMALFIATVLSLPITVRELMSFIKPGLTKTEYEVIQKVSRFAALLFLVGCVISFFIIMPITLNILAASGTIIGGEALEVWYDVNSVMNLLLWGTLGAGILYASPLILLALIQLEILTANQVANRRREVIFGVFTLAAIITPDPTMVSMVILSLPMLIIVEGVILWGFKIESNKLIDRTIRGTSYD
jgi:sec-independent protein translocase protein TatC